MRQDQEGVRMYVGGECALGVQTVRCVQTKARAERRLTAEHQGMARLDLVCGTPKCHVTGNSARFQTTTTLLLY